MGVMHVVIQFPLYEGIKSHFIRHPLLPHEGGEKERLTMWVGVPALQHRLRQRCKLQTFVITCPQSAAFLS